MINIEYAGVPQETANATLDFLVNRPFLKTMFWFMKVSCIMLCVGFGVTLYHKAAIAQDFVAVFFAVMWLFYYKSMNRWIIKRNLKRVKFGEAPHIFKIDNRSIFCKLPSRNPVDIEWKKFKYVLKNNDGYILPLTGITNGGKFVWLPYRAFTSPEIESEFLALVAKFKLKTKTIISG